MGKTNKRDKYFCPGSVENRVNANFSHLKTSALKKNMKTMYFSDPLLIPRINQYLSDNKDKVYIDINDMVNELQSQYRDYARRKRNAFKPLVEKAFSFVLQQCGLEQNNSEEMNNCAETSENSSSDVEECNSEDEGKTSSNNQLVNLYNSSNFRAQLQLSKHYQATSNDNAELIDLSSDDENSKKKDGGEEKGISAAKLNNLQNRIANKETTLTLIKAGSQSQTKVGRPTVTITAKRSRSAVEEKLPFKMSKKKKIVIPEPKPITFADFGGDPKVLEEVCKLVLHISHPEIYKEIGVTPPRGFLLHGPPGCGKTLLATAVAGELEVELIHISAPELVGGVSGESEERIRDLFERAVESTPCVLFIDEVDAICTNRENAQREMERRIVAQLLTCLDDLNNKPNGEMVLVIGATNRPDSIDPALRRAGRFDREVCLGIPDSKTREKILKVLCSNLNLSSDFSFEELALITPGFVGADLLSLTREAATVAINRVLGILQTIRNKDRSLKIQKQNKESEENGQTTNKEKANKEDETMEVDVETTDRETTTKNMDNEVSDKNKYTDEKSEIEEEKEDEAEAVEEKTKEKESEFKAGSSVEDLQSEASKETKVASEEEIDVEVIADNAPKNQPTLETLLYWLRDSSPLPHRQLKNVCITQDDFKQALNFVQPSSRREGFATVPDVTWEDVGSLADVREELQMSVLGPVKYRKQFEELGLSTPAGILICGPPGCGKTLLAKAVANEAKINFISVKGPELLNMYVGESERAVRRCFQRARNSAPCVIFFDELDALCPKRSDSAENGATMRVVNQLLTEMDGIEDRKEVYLMAATNRPDIIDPAVLRPGRLDKVIYVGLPQAEDRVDILRALTKNGTRPKLASDVNLEMIALKEECSGFSGADLAALIREAGVQAVKELMTKSETDPNAEAAVCERHFEVALKKIHPSVNPDNRKYYESIKKKYAASKT